MKQQVQHFKLSMSFLCTDWYFYKHLSAAKTVFRTARVDLGRTSCVPSLLSGSVLVSLISGLNRVASLQVAIRNAQQGVFYFSDKVPLEALIDQENSIQPNAFIPLWRSLPDSNELVQTIQVPSQGIEAFVKAVSTHFKVQVKPSMLTNDRTWMQNHRVKPGRNFLHKTRPQLDCKHCSRNFANSKDGTIVV